MAEASPRELKCARMVKRSQGKKRIGVVNYKDRVFVLTETDLSYYDGNLVVGSLGADVIVTSSSVLNLGYGL